MFGGKKNKDGVGSVGVETLIGRQTEILGDVRFTGGLHVDGTIRGKVIAASDKASALSVSEHGAIEGDVRVPTVVLNGSITGDVYASQKVSISSKARINGNVTYRVLEMELGAQVNGQLLHDQAGEPAAVNNTTGRGKGEPAGAASVKDASNAS